MDQAIRGVSGDSIVRKIVNVVLARCGGHDRARVHEDLAPYAEDIDRLVDAAFEAGYVTGVKWARQAIDLEVERREIILRRNS
jgi:hypothetical protein